MLIETERLVLRDYVEEDWREQAAYHADERYWRYYEKEGWHGDASERERIGHFLACQTEDPRRSFQLAVTLKGGGRLIGGCALRVRRLVDHGRSDAAWEADIGYEIDPACWGNGYAPEATGALLRFGFDDLGLHRIWAYCIADNRNSVRVLEKLGLHLEGHLRENHSMQGRWWDSLVFGILADEWRGLQAERPQGR